MHRDNWILFVRYAAAVALLLLSGFLYSFFKPLTFYSSYVVTSVFADTVFVAHDTFRIGVEEFLFVPACAAVLAYVLLYVLILFTRGISFRLGLKIALVGSVVIFLVNLLRIELLIFVLLEYGKNYFQTLHLFLWKFVSTVFVALLWIYFVLRHSIKEVPFYGDITFIFKKR